MTRLYLTSTPSTFSATISGGWNDTSSSGMSNLSVIKSGGVVTATSSEASDILGWRSLLRRFVSPPVVNTKTFTAAVDTYQLMFGRSADSAAAASTSFYVHVRTSTGALRGVLINHNYAGTWPATPTAALHSAAVTGTVTVQPGDRFVLEIGWYASNVVAEPSYSASMRYGGTGADLTSGSTAVSTQVAWFDVVDSDLVFGPPNRTVTDPAGATHTITGRKSQVSTVTQILGATHPIIGQRGKWVYQPLAATHAVTGAHDAGPLTVAHDCNAEHLLTGSHDTEATVSHPFAAEHQVWAEIEGSLLEPPPDLEHLISPYQQPPGRGLRFIAQEIRTGKILDWNLPLTDPQLTYTLSGPSIIRATVEPEQALVTELKLDAWATWLHVELDGQIRASAILQPAQFDGETMTVDAVGVSGYPNGLIYLEEMSEIQIDPLDVYRRLWTHVQSYPDGNLGVSVAETTSPQRLGEPEKQAIDEETGLPEYDEETGQPVMEEAEPYELAWYNNTDIGSELDQLVKNIPADYAEQFSWNTTHTAVNHHIDIGYPRLGRKRDDLRFALGENIIAAFPAIEQPDYYASQVLVVGNGEGSAAIRGYAGLRSPTRLRRMATITDKTIMTTARANALAKAELLRRQAVLSIAQIVVRASHDNARWGSYGLGDDIPIIGRIPYLGDLALWHRITAMLWRPDTDEVTISMRRSENFSYGRIESGGGV